MRVYQVLAPAPFGGAETICLSLASVLGTIGVECTLVLLVGAVLPDALLARAERLGLATIILRNGRREYHRDVQILHRLVMRDDSAILHSHLARANLVTRATATLARRPCVATVHGHFGTAMRDRLHDVVDLGVLRTMDALVCVSHTAATAMRRRNPGRANRVHTMPSALLQEPAETRTRARDELGIAHDGMLVGWVGRLVGQKHPELFVRCVAEMARRAALPEPWRAVMIGDGPLLAASRQLAADLGLAERLIFSGFRPDAGRLVSAFDSLAITSRGEELPTVLLECLGRGVPVVSTSAGDVPLIAARCGAVRVCKATPAAFAETLAGVLTTFTDRPTLARQAREYIDRDHRPSTWAEGHRELYARLAHRVRPRGKMPYSGGHLP